MSDIETVAGLYAESLRLVNQLSIKLEISKTQFLADQDAYNEAVRFVNQRKRELLEAAEKTTSPNS